MDEFIIILRLLVAAVMGAAIGIERATRKSTAGMRTFSLVCLGAALTMIVNEFLTLNSATGGDPARLSAQVISGMGFLGMGCIMVTSRNQVKGLTTAATLWTTAILGLAIGAGMMEVAAAAFIIIIIVVHLLSHASHKLEDYTRILTLYVEVDKNAGIQGVINVIDERNYEIISMEKKKTGSVMEESIALQLDIDLKEKMKHSEFVSLLMEMPEVKYIEEVRKV